jgi:hypothetical protein
VALNGLVEGAVRAFERKGAPVTRREVEQTAGKLAGDTLVLSGAVKQTAKSLEESGELAFDAGHPYLAGRLQALGWQPGRTRLADGTLLRYSRDNWASYTDVPLGQGGFTGLPVGESYQYAIKARLTNGQRVDETWLNDYGKNFRVGKVDSPTPRANGRGLIGTDVQRLADGDPSFQMKSPGAKTYFAEAAQTVGFDHLPSVETQAQIDSAVKGGERELFRGISGPQSGQFADEFRYGALHGGTAGTSVYGAGTYVAYGPRGLATADKFSRGGTILRMALKGDAKVIKAQDLIAMREAEQNLPPFLKTDLGLYGVHKGYDAIDIPEQGYMAILNRGALRVQETNQPKPFYVPGMARPA